MKIVNIDDIEIKYPEEKEREEIAIADYYKKNRHFGQMILPKKIKLSSDSDEEYKFVLSLEDLIEQSAKELIRGSKNYSEEDLDKILNELYLNLLLDQYDTDLFYTSSGEKVHKDVILFCIKSFLETDIEKLKTFITNPTEEEKEQSVHDLREKIRERTLNHLLGIYVDMVEENEKDLLDVIEKYMPKLLKHFMSIERINLMNQELDINFSPLSTNQLETIFEEFLKDFDPTLEWMMIWENLKKKGKVHYIQARREKENKSYAKEDEICISQRGNLEDVKSLAHEFAHYIALQKGPAKIAVEETPSIALENAAITYLEKIGYDKEEIKSLRLLREQEITKKFIELEGVLSLIIRYKNNGKITTQELFEYLKQRAEAIKENELNIGKMLIQETQNDEFYKKALEIDTSDETIMQNTKKQIDLETITMVQNGTKIITINSYLLGYYISYLLESNSNRNRILKYITEHLPELNVDEIINKIQNKPKMYLKANE